MDIKDANLVNAVTEALKDAEVDKDVYVIPGDGDCMKDIDNVCVQVNDFITKSFKKLGESENQEENSKILNTCMETIRLLDTYKTVRINVELSSRIQFNISSTKKGKE